jgi:hypothetical protein
MKLWGVHYKTLGKGSVKIIFNFARAAPRQGAIFLYIRYIKIRVDFGVTPLSDSHETLREMIRTIQGRVL